MSISRARLADSKRLDVLTGKTIGDFRKPIDLAAKIGQNHELQAGIKHRTEDQQRIEDGQ